MKTAACNARVGAALAIAFWIGAAAAATAADGIVLAYVPVDLHPENRAVDRVGGLRYRGGLEISSSDKRFGGYSGLVVEAHGRGIIAVSDRGHWLTARLGYDRKGNLAGIDNVRVSSLRDLAGKPLRGKSRADAESLARTDSGIAVGFERRHRIVFYSAAHGQAVRQIRAPEALSKRGLLLKNQGIEALAPLPGGRFLALAEGPDGAYAFWPGWIVDANGWRRLTYTRTNPFRPTDAAALPSGDILVLERRFSLIGGIASRLSVIPRRSIKPGATLAGKEVARLRPPLIVENFEGVAARRDGTGRTLIYLISDDNFNIIQRTLLLMFELTEPD